MSYLTTNGNRVEFPYALYIKAVNTQNDDVIDIANSTYEIFNYLQQTDTELTTLREENKRLRYENEFMLRLINSKED
jgi:organic radical activating enzyme